MQPLFLRLEGPLQAWGVRSRWGERDTTDAPTKSGIIGLLGCALGVRREDRALRELSDAMRLGVRIDLPGTRLRDYHTTGGGRFGDTIHQGGSRFHDEPYVGGVLSAEVDAKGRIKVKINATTKEPETDTSERHYLADASFLAAVQSDQAALIERLATALQTPVWPCFLGRKACVPAAPIFAGVGEYADLRAALEAGPFSERVELAWRREQVRPVVRLLIESLPGQGARQNDNAGNPARRVFRPRYVREEWWTPPALTPVDPLAPPSINTLEG